ncbi:MAG: nucleobase:cation symporter-2 family protein [Ornithinibacter sp.]
MTQQAAPPETEIHPVDEVLPVPQMFIYGLQHVLSMYAGVVAVPLIVGNALGLSGPEITYLVSAGLFISGLATILQTVGIWKLGARQPIVQGTSFAAVSTILTIGTEKGGKEGLVAVFGALIVAGALAFLIAPIFTSLLRFFPEVVTGTVITVIGISLLPVAMKWAAGGAGSKTFGAPKNIAVAAITMAIIVLIYRFAPPFFSRIAILAGLVLGSIVAIPFGLTDFGKISDASVFQLTTPFHYGLPTFAVGASISMFIVMLVIMTETTADILAIGEVVGKPADRQTVTNGLRADMGSTVFAGFFNGFSVSAFAQNVGLVAITGIKSRFVVAVGGVILVLLGLFPILGAFVAIVPLPVLGGAGLALFGTVAASGIRTLTNVDFSGNANLVIVALSLSMGIIPIAVPEFYDQFPAWFVVIFDSGITAAAITAVLLNVVFNIVGRSGETEGPIFAEAPPVAAISEEDEERLLNEGRDAADQRPFHHDAGQARHEAPRAAHTGSVASEHGAPTTTPTTEHDPTTQTKESGS